MNEERNKEDWLGGSFGREGEGRAGLLTPALECIRGRPLAPAPVKLETPARLLVPT